MDSTPLSVRSAPLTDLSADLDRTGAALADVPSSSGPDVVGATALALGLIATELVAVLLRAVVEHHRATTEAGDAIRQIALVTATSADAYAATDGDTARLLNAAGVSA